jgi:hypothetical protein
MVDAGDNPLSFTIAAERQRRSNARAPQPRVAIVVVYQTAVSSGAKRSRKTRHRYAATAF